MHKQQKPPCFIIEGNIGAGKSTLVSLIQKQLDVHVIFEPHDQWQAVGGTENLLDRFYKDTARWAYTFQSYAFITRVRAQEEHAKLYPHMPQVLERSVYSDRYCFAKNCYELGFMNTLEWKLYQEWFTWLVDNYTAVPDGFIYLRVDPEVCYARLTKRDRHEESNVKLDYLISLHTKHENWLMQKTDIESQLQKVPVLTIDGNKEFEHDPIVQQEIVDAIRAFVTSRQMQKEQVSAPHAMGL
jgi:deoxyadenosine/deoxycytidine kinase